MAYLFDIGEADDFKKERLIKIDNIYWYNYSQGEG